MKFCLLFAFVIASTVAVPCRAESGDVEHFTVSGTSAAQLTIHGTTDVEMFAVAIRDYQQLHPATEVAYVELTAQNIYDQYLARSVSQEEPDMLISSGMDLQTRLVNDGYAVPHRSAGTEALPAWAQWRNEVFAISYEPIAIVYNRKLLPAAQVPRSRRQLLRLLRAPEAPLKGRVGTYDVERSRVGYLLATQDSQLGSIAGALFGALGDNDVRLEELTSALLDRVASGELLLAYNVLGSYAYSRIKAGAPLGVVLPEDYTLVVLRTALIPRSAPNVEEARRFLDYLLSPRGQRVLANEAPPILPQAGTTGLNGATPKEILRPIAMGPGLLVYLDQLKRRQFLDAWRSSVQHTVP